jgi:hypothetical protein
MPVLRPVVDSCLAQMTSETPEELRSLAVDILSQSLDGEFVGPDVAQPISK